MTENELFGISEQLNDTISRQAAIDALKMDISIIPFAKAREYVREAIETIYNRLEELPSAQPEIIRCKDCKFYSPMNRETKTGICNLIMHQNFGDNWFCAGAERRPDESDRKRRCPMADGMQKEEQDERYYQPTGGD